MSNKLYLYEVKSSESEYYPIGMILKLHRKVTARTTDLDGKKFELEFLGIREARKVE